MLPVFGTIPELFKTLLPTFPETTRFTLEQFLPGSQTSPDWGEA